VATNTIESLSLAKDALQQVIAFNRLAGTGGGQRADGKPVDDLARGSCLVCVTSVLTLLTRA
jgi:hypothetical protein